MADRKIVMISSTTNDLAEHRRQVSDACLSQRMIPLMMEHLPASDAQAVEVSLQMVDDADVYLGIFAHRYGHVPQGHDVSITEMEYDRAVKRGIPRLIFIMHEDHPVLIKDVDKGEKAAKLAQLKKRLLEENVVDFFRSADHLQAGVTNSLSWLREAGPSQVKAPTRPSFPERSLAGRTISVPGKPVPSPPPHGATARCRDGTFSFSRSHSGACSYHGGVKDWLA
jgi:hypothetical protein